MEALVTKSRTPSRCREWERNRRNKFNDAISRLGEVVKEILKTNSGAKDVENVQYPKVEIVEKAIVCLTTFVQEKAQLKAELLALQVKVDMSRKQIDKKDVSTQVFIGVSKKTKNDKYVKVVMLRKSKRKALKEKPILTANTINQIVDVDKPIAKDTNQKKSIKQPVLLPKIKLNDKKGPENTIVVLPAASYIFPQRPLLLPSVPPAFVLVDQNLQTLNKSTFPILNRSSNDVTKTTMVNILPISAYSRPLSATKTKKTRPKVDLGRKNKKLKQANKPKEKQTTTDKLLENKRSVEEEDGQDENKNKNSSTKVQKQGIKEPDSSKIIAEQAISTVNVNPKPTSESINAKNVTIDIVPKTVPAIFSVDEKSETVKITETSKTAAVLKGTSTVPASNVKKINAVENSDENNKPFKIPAEKERVLENENNKSFKVPAEKESVLEKDKESKLPNILVTALCENTVDGGNARLELAEEFLAASPTAAFLMSFPLVSGNRADSPAEETPNTISINTKDINQRRDLLNSHALPYFEKPNLVDVKAKTIDKPILSNNSLNKQNEQQKYMNNNLTNTKDIIKTSNSMVTSNATNENPFLNLSMSSLLPTSCTLSDTTFGLDFDCSINKSMPNQSSSYVNNSNLFYKTDPFSTVKSTIYSTSSISSGHEFNSFGLYPCAMEKYATKNKSEYSNVEDNLMKIGSSRLTYDIDLGWSHKGFDFVSCTSASNTFNKDNILTTASGSYSSTYNPFNPEFHVPLVSHSNKRESSASKPTPSYPDAITSFYSQPTNLWSEEAPFYNNTPKSVTSRHQNYVPVENTQTNPKQNNPKHFESKQVGNIGVENTTKPTNSGSVQQASEKYKKSPSKMHINWMTSEVRPMQTICNPTHTELKQTHKPIYSQIDQTTKKHDLNEHHYFPISMHNFSSQSGQDELQVWPSVRPAGTTEISIDPPPINLPTLVGDLALGPHDRKKTTDVVNRGATTNQTDIQNCSNFFSVTQLMNRSTDNTVPTRYQGATNAAVENQNQKSIQSKLILNHTTSEQTRKPMTNTESHILQPCYVYNDSKTMNSYENMNQFSLNKAKVTKSEKNSKAQKNSYSAESLIRGGSCNQKLPDNNSAKFMIPAQKYNDFNTTQDSSVAQVSHFPPILDYSDNSYSGQQFSGTNLYNTTTNTISNSFYSNFMSGSSNLMPGNYTSGPFSGEIIDYNQTSECSYPNHKYTELKIRNQPSMFQQEKTSSNYKSARRDSAAKHKLECSKKDSNKKCQSKRAKLNNEVEEWGDTSHLLWQNRNTSKRHGNLMPEELPFANYMGNQMAAAAAAGQYQPDIFNSHIMSSNMQPVGQNVDRSLTSSFPVTSRANFNLSTIFPEITMKVQ